MEKRYPAPEMVDCTRDIIIQPCPLWVSPPPRLVLVFVKANLRVCDFILQAAPREGFEHNAMLFVILYYSPTLGV